MTGDPPLRALLLAAGYGTRLGDLGRVVPKPLLFLGGRPLADHLLDGLAGIGHLSGLLVVTNSRFFPEVEAWSRRARDRVSFAVRILDDGTSRPEDRLGAVGDLALGLESLPPGGDLLVLAGDTVPGFSLGDLVREWARRPAADVLLALEEEKDPARLQFRGVVRMGETGRVVEFREKPPDPASSLIALPLYLFRARALPHIPEYLAGGGDPDAPGHLIEWLVDRVRVEGWRAPGPGRLDVGTPEGLREARRRLGDGPRR